MKGYNKFVEDRWRSIEVNGWGKYFLKVKLRIIKSHLKVSHKNHLGNLHGRIDEAKKIVNEVDLKGEESILLAEEIESKRDATIKLLSL